MCLDVTLDRPPWESRGALRTPHSLAYFCPVCGELWARLRQPNAPAWRVIARRCETHGEGWLSYNCEKGIIPALTTELLIREFRCASANPRNFFCTGG
jgi:hypothetical protein